MSGSIQVMFLKCVMQFVIEAIVPFRGYGSKLIDACTDNACSFLNSPHKPVYLM